MNKENIIITKIFWKRTYFFIEYTGPFAKLALVRHNNTHILETKEISKNLYRSKINITIAEGREILKPGKWAIKDLNGNPLILSKEIYENIENFSRVFRYDTINAYIITFELSENEPLILYLNASFMTINKHPEKRTFREILNNSKKAQNFFKLLSKKILNLYYKLLCIIPVSSKKILFMSENMDHIRDNMEALNKRILERKLNETYKLDYNFINLFDKKIHFLYWPIILIKISRSKYIFVDDYVPTFSFLKIRKETIVTQMWHAGFGFKLVGYGRFGIKGSPNPYESCHRKYTYGIIGNEYLKEIYSEVWGIEKEALIATGLPRLEHFLDTSKIIKTREIIAEDNPNFKGKRIITFAPTYRGYNQKDAYYDYSKINFEKLYKVCQKTNSIFLFKMHTFIKEDVPIPEEYQDLIKQIKNYKLNDLFYITDILITDYSSCFYDFLLLNKPIIFYVYDLDVYKATRGIHRSIEQIAPGKICLTFQDLVNTLEQVTLQIPPKRNLLLDKCLENTTLASDQIIDKIILNKEVK